MDTLRTAPKTPHNSLILYAMTIGNAYLFNRIAFFSNQSPVPTAQSIRASLISALLHPRRHRAWTCYHEIPDSSKKSIHKKLLPRRGSSVHLFTMTLDRSILHLHRGLCGTPSLLCTEGTSHNSNPHTHQNSRRASSPNLFSPFLKSAHVPQAPENRVSSPNDGTRST